LELNAEAVDNLRRRAAQDVDAGHIPSCQFALALDGEVLVQETLGRAPSGARYCMFSATKAVFASLVWQLMGEGKLDPAAPVVELWPEFGAHGKDRVTLEHLLLHTAGFPTAGLEGNMLNDRAGRARQMEQWKLEWEPGTRFAYHAATVHYVMAELVDRVTEQGYCAELRARVLDPLGLDRLELGVPEPRQGDVQPMVAAGDRGTAAELAEVLGLSELPPSLTPLFEGAAPPEAEEAQELPTLVLIPEAMAAGIPAGGAVSDAASLALFYQALLHDPKGVWDPAVLRDVTSKVRNTLPGPFLGGPAMRTLGLEVQGDDHTARLRSGSGAASPTTFGHGGAHGQIAWADPTTGLSFAYLTNGADRNVAREHRRTQELAAAAVACIVP
jgi:CubicO group peptidase (beta-lactamase class C family)